MNFDLITNDRGRRTAKSYEFETSGQTCWNWTGGKMRRGYGKVRVDTVMGKMNYAHRLMYLLHYGPFDPAKVVRHKCNNPSCINPDHIELGTKADNSRDMVVAGRSTRGEKNWSSKLTAEDVLKIRETYPALAEKIGKRAAQIELGVLYNVEWTGVGKIVNRKAWTHI